MAFSLVGLGFFAGLFLWKLSPWAQHGFLEMLQQEQQLIQACGPELHACQTRLSSFAPVGPAGPGDATQEPAQPQAKAGSEQPSQKSGPPQKAQPQPKAQSEQKAEPPQKVPPEEKTQPQPKAPASAGKGSDGKQ
jgi:outer membrane biosynthesis protein TonB